MSDIIYDKFIDFPRTFNDHNDHKDHIFICQRLIQIVKARLIWVVNDFIESQQYAQNYCIVSH